MRRILKWQVPAFGAAEITTDDAILWRAVGWQGEMLVAWGEGSVEWKHGGARTRLFAIPTGATVPEDALYVGTAQHPTLLDGSPLVMHVYAKEVE